MALWKTPGVVLHPAAVACLSLLVVAPPANAQDAPARKIDTALIADLETFLPAPDGWTRKRGDSGFIPLSETTGYSYAAVVLTREAAELRITVADSGGTDDALMALATMVVLLPEGHDERLEPDTRIRRLAVGGFPAAERWDAAKHEGDFVILLNKRFVVSGDGKGLESLAILTTVLQQIDLTKLATLR
jgi:hypothetical protein